MDREVPGKYIHEKTASHYLELKPDGQCFLFQGAAGVISGRYEIHGADITIFGAESTSKGKIQNGVVTDADGDRWIRKPQTIAQWASADASLESISWLPDFLKKDLPWELFEAIACVVVLIGLLISR